MDKQMKRLSVGDAAVLSVGDNGDPVRVGNSQAEILIYGDGRIEINGSRITVNGKPMEPQEP